MKKIKIQEIISFLGLLLMMLVRFLSNFDTNYIGLLLFPITISFIFKGSHTLKYILLTTLYSTLTAFIFWGEFSLNGILCSLAGSIIAFTARFLVRHID